MHYCTLVLLNNEQYIDDLLDPHAWPGDDCLRCLDPELRKQLLLVEKMLKKTAHSQSGDDASTRKPLFEKCPIIGNPTPECLGSGATGKEAKWDWWVIGGNFKRYLSDLLFNEREAASDSDKEMVTIPVKDLPLPLEARYTPYAVVTPDGQWHERRGDSDEAVADWQSEVQELLAQNMEATAAICDMHSI